MKLVVKEIKSANCELLFGDIELFTIVFFFLKNLNNLKIKNPYIFEANNYR